MGIGLTGQHTFTGDRGLTRATTWGDESGGLYQGHHMGRGGPKLLTQGRLGRIEPSYLKETIKCLALRKYAIRSCLLLKLISLNIKICSIAIIKLTLCQQNNKSRSSNSVSFNFTECYCCCDWRLTLILREKFTTYKKKKLLLLLLLREHCFHFSEFTLFLDHRARFLSLACMYNLAFSQV
jgi:hypothetical protein